MIYSISLLNKHLYFLEVHCTTLYKVSDYRYFSCTSCTAVRSILCTVVNLAGGGRSADQLPGQALTTRSRKVFRIKDLRQLKLDTGSVCIHGGLQQWGFTRWLAELRLRFIVAQLHTRSLNGQRDWKPHKILPVHTDSFSFESRIGQDRAQLWRA